MFLIIARLIPISWTRVPFLLRWARLRHVPDPPGLFWSFVRCGDPPLSPCRSSPD